MKKSVVFLLVVISLFACVSTAFAKDASELIGTITSYVEEIQGYPEALRDACGTDMFKQKLTELANLITGANDAMAEAGLPNTLNLWAVYSAVTSNIGDCSFFTSALSKADWSREELDRIGYKYGLFDTQLKKAANVNKCLCLQYREKCGEQEGCQITDECIKWSEVCEPKCLCTTYDGKGNCIKWSEGCEPECPCTKFGDNGICIEWSEVCEPKCLCTTYDEKGNCTKWNPEGCEIKCLCTTYDEKGNCTKWNPEGCGEGNPKPLH